MSLVQHYLQTAAQLCGSYDGTTPFHFVLREFFPKHKKYGSRDRKFIGGLCYSFFRLGKAVPEIEPIERIVWAWFLCSSEPNRLLAEINESWNDWATLPLKEKLEKLGMPFSVEQIAPFTTQLSTGIDPGKYAAHFLTQPDVFIRIRPRNEKPVVQQLKKLEWDFELIDDAVRLPSGTAIDKNFLLNKQVVVQDIHSQKVGSIIKEVFEREMFVPAKMWDCCAASGGKSIMMKDLYPHLQITVSDIRPSILQNLNHRFKEAGIHSYQSFVADLTKEDGLREASKKLDPAINFIIADVPCTGSGTWSRTPEQLYFFKEEMIASYAERQMAIAANALSYVRSGGCFVYITCSVFKQENEEVVTKLVEQYSLQLLHNTLLNGTSMKADSMFVAVLKKP
jgi:16S rRNA (cytosine967-C5)-methyltransferase